METTRACLDCSADISQRHHNARRCHDCAPLASARAWAEKDTVQDCAVHDEECTPGRLRRGVCPLHYSRLKTRGVTTPPPPPIDQFARYTVLDNGCWRWDGPTNPESGYGHSPASTGDGMAHRAFYAHYVGPIPEGATIDHMCHNRDTACRGGVTCPHRRCVNPAHLDPVPQAVNTRRAHTTRDLCRAGIHDLREPGARRWDGQCTECWRARYRPAQRRYQARRRGDPGAEPRRRLPMGHTPRRLDRPMTRNRVIRAWARSQGMDVAVKAMIPVRIQLAFDALIQRVTDQAESA